MCFSFLSSDLWFLANIVPDLSGTFKANTSSLILFASTDMSATVYVEEYRDHTLITGLSDLGGVFTVVDGVFSLLFGATLIQLMFGEYHTYHTYLNID